MCGGGGIGGNHTCGPRAVCARAVYHVRHTRSLRGRWAGYIRCGCREFVLSMYNVNGRTHVIR